MPLAKEDRTLLFEVAADLQDRVESDGFESLSPAEKVVHCVWQFTGEINSGGADRYFFYDGATHAEATIQALGALCRPELARALEEAIGHFSGIDLSSIDARQEHMTTMKKEEKDALARLSRPVIAYDPEPDLWRVIDTRRGEFRYLKNA
jgi:hypothetical protein